tara:strand:- start:41 stop:235 length:195 start_codon:yes stop_codon:yes gene_type:complete
MTSKLKKYKALGSYDVDKLDNYEGLGYENHVLLKGGKSVELEDTVAKPLIDKKYITIANSKEVK